MLEYECSIESHPNEVTRTNWLFTALAAYTAKDMLDFYGESWYFALEEITQNILETCYESLILDIRKALILLRLTTIEFLEGDTEYLSHAANRGELYCCGYYLDEHAHHLIATRGGGFSCTN